MLQRTAHTDIVFYRSPMLSGLGVPHAFGTRLGDDHAIAAALGLGGHDRVTIRQVHGQNVHLEDHLPAHNDAADPRCDADAIILRRADAWTRIITADCVPVLLSSLDGRSVCAIHAGWRGVVGDVITAAVDTLACPFIAAIGPCISADYFEVGPDISAKFDARFVRNVPGQSPHVDLRAAVHEKLHHLGAQAIDGTDRCTYRDSAEFYSHRRDVTHNGQDTTGRMASVIACAG